MANLFFTGTAASIAQQDRYTPATVQVGDVFTLTITGEDGSTNAIAFTAVATTVAGVTAGLVAAWNASTNPLCTPITAADVTTSLTLTADVAGVPFSVAATTTDGGGANTQTLTKASVTANSGPNDWGTALNWSTLAVPVSTDSVTLDGRMAAAITYGLQQTAVTLTALTHVKGAKAVGTTTAPLAISVTTADINKAPTDNSNASASFIAINTGTNATTISVWGSASTGTSGIEPVSIKGAHASNVLKVYDGIVGLSIQKPGDTANFPATTVSGSRAQLTIGSGTSTVTTLNVKDGAAVTLRAAATTVDTSNGAKLTTEGSGAIATANIDGVAALNSTGTITALNIQGKGDVDTTQTPRTATITTTSIYGGGKLKTDLNTTYTNGKYCYQGAQTNQVTEPDGTKIVTSAAP